jgi:hypothetical protein
LPRSACRPAAVSRYAQLVNVHQAVGGGWVDIAAEIAPKPLGLAAAQARP